ncbi:MAG TPA: hypothetical protein VHX15_04980 [Frankiaceae bacterium]|jgi:hypothetical protein|nr:hypothetical protein [Frankiaceae bacterium]
MNAIIASLEGALHIPTKRAQSGSRAPAAPDVFGELMAESKWSPKAFEEWVAETLSRELLSAQD